MLNNIISQVNGMKDIILQIIKDESSKEIQKSLPQGITVIQIDGLLNNYIDRSKINPSITEIEKILEELMDDKKIRIVSKIHTPHYTYNYLEN